MEPSMLRRIVWPALLVLAGTSTPLALAVDDPRFAADFVQGLREKGYYELALDYLDQVRRSPDAPAGLKQTLDYEEGKTLIEAATHANDPDASKEKLDQAKAKIEAFVKAYPDLPETTEALVELARLLYERGRTEVDLGGDARAPAEKDNRLVAARGYYGSARDAYNRAYERLDAKLAAYPKFIPADDPKKAEREKARNSLMSAELQRSIVGYEEAQTFPAGSKERGDLLGVALASFDDIYKRYRVQLAGFTARMWQAKCFEEQGKLGEAMGIYNELIDQSHPALRQLQKQVDYFRIIVMSKRKEFALAADECSRWLAAFPKDRRSYEALGVQFELGKDILAQLPGLSGPDRDKAVRAATDHLADVVRVVSPFKPDALALLQKYRPNVALSAADVSKMSFDDAMAQAEQSISLLEYDKAIALLKVAVRKAEPTRDPVKANRARYMLAFCCYMTKRYYEAAVITEFIARRYPGGEWAAKATEIAMAALVDAYNTYTAGNRTADLDRLVALAKYTAETWPETEQGDSARMAMGQVALGRGRYAEAVAALDSVRPASAKWIEAQAVCGGAHWKQGQALRDKGDEKGADAEAAQGVAKLKLGLKARKDANVPDTDPGYINNACDLAGIELETGKAPEAIALLEPISRKLLANRSAGTAPLGARVVAGMLRGHVAIGKVDLAIEDMKTLEALGGAGTTAAQLYFELGKLLEREMEALRRRNDGAGLARTEQAYRKFLKALVASKSGQSYQSLRWAADNLLKLGAAKEASEVYANILDFYAKDPDFQKAPNAADNLLRVKIRQVAALRGAGSLSEAESILAEVIDQNKRLLEPQMEKGYLLDAKAEAKQGATWPQAYAYWKSLALKLANMNPKPVDYFEAWYHAAVALQKQGKPDLARQTVASVSKLSRDLGSPEMKAKYEAFAKQVAK